MRKFHSEDFSIRLADGLSSVHLTIPDDECREALDYVKQFIQRSNGSAYLHRGYLPEKYLDALVRVRDESTGSRQFSRAVEALGVDGGVSQPADYETFTHIEVETTRDNIYELNDTYYSVKSDDAKKMVRTIQDLIRYNKYTLSLYLPAELADQIQV